MDARLKKHGAISWSELMTSDVTAAKSFYQKLFGWVFDDMPMEKMTYSVVKVNGEGTAGIMPMPPDAGPMPPAWGLYVTVDDVDATVEKAVSMGGKICMPPCDIPGVGRICAMQDPQGAHISIIRYFN
jgi:predicted enzyme related to lactoylglutathione lyase